MKFNRKLSAPILVCASILFLTTLLTSCDSLTPSEKISKQTISVSDFESLDVSNAFTVYVDNSERESVEIEANENLQEYIQVEKEGKQLHISLKKSFVTGKAVLNAYVSAKHLNEFKGSGATQFILRDNLKADKINIDLSGASSLTGNIAAINFMAVLTGASSIKLDGSADIVVADCSGASSIEGYGFQSREASIEVSGASDAKLTVNEKLNAEASGASTINYKGNAVIGSQNSSGASNINKE